jgi:hypothetical protein
VLQQKLYGSRLGKNGVAPEIFSTQACRPTPSPIPQRLHIQELVKFAIRDCRLVARVRLTFQLQGFLATFGQRGGSMDKANRRDVDWRELCERASKEMDPEKLM